MTTNANLDSLLKTSAEVGGLTYMAFDDAVVLCSDSHIKKAGGVPKNGFLLATPGHYVGKQFVIDSNEIVLLKVRDVAKLSDSSETARLKENLVKSERENIDPHTRATLAFVGFDCKVAGAFYMVDEVVKKNGKIVLDEKGKPKTTPKLEFGSDVDQVFAHSSYRVFRPSGESLSIIASYKRVKFDDNGDPIDPVVLDVGVVRFTETRSGGPDQKAKVLIDASDFVGHKTAVFGMSRSGKALSEDTRIPVPMSAKFPSGWALNRDLEVGDEVLGTDGSPVKVVALTGWSHEQMYAVDFADGQVVKTSGNHLWRASDAYSRSKQGDIRKSPKAVHKASTVSARVALADSVSATTYADLNTLSFLLSIPSDTLRKTAVESGIAGHLAFAADQEMTVGETQNASSQLYPVRELTLAVVESSAQTSTRIVSTSEMFESGIATSFGESNWSLEGFEFNSDRIAVSPKQHFIKSIRTIEHGLVRCLTVESPDSQHLVEGFIPTHNSNTMKVIIQQVYEYSKQFTHESGEKVGQLILDPQGEYSNDNTQDGGSIYSMGENGEVKKYRAMRKNEVDETVTPLAFNFLDAENASLVWDIMLSELNNSMSGNANYVAGLRNVVFVPKDAQNDSSLEVGERNKLKLQRQRQLLALYALMGMARYEGNIKGMLNVEIGIDNTPFVHRLDAESTDLQLDSLNSRNVRVLTTHGALVLFRWLMDGLPKEGEEKKAKRRRSETEDDGAQIPEEDVAPPIPVLTQSWLKDFTSGDLSEFHKQFISYDSGRNGLVAAFWRMKELHSEEALSDVRNQVWEDMTKGRISMIDLSKGSTRVASVLSEMIVNYILDQASTRFVSGEDSVKIQVVIEEAHNLFRREGAKEDSIDPYVRLSKEAAKYKIGLLYATQEVSAVDPQILSNTANWVVAHLNSKTETGVLSRYYSFDEWSDHLRACESKGFVRLKMLSSPLVIPVQVSKFIATKAPTINQVY